MESPFFSIIIPTRNRYETLFHTMRTVLCQDFGSFELVISDNSDEDSLPRIGVINEYLKDDRVRYYRPPGVLSMSDSWEFAVSKSTGEYIILFGDDDGLVAGSLRRMHDIITSTNAEILSWTRVEYSWPERTPKEAYSNLMIIPYTSKTGLIDSEKYIKHIVSFKADYRLLPMFYNSAISRKMTELLKAKAGRLFNASSPDVFTGYAFAHMLGKYITIGYPLSINGVSAKSNGAVHDNGDELKKEHWNLLKKSEIKWPSELPHFYTAYLGIIEPFIQLTKYFPELNKYISRKEVYKNIVDHLDSANKEDLEEKITVILSSAENDKRLHKWLEGYLNTNRPQHRTDPLHNVKSRVGFNGSHLILDASDFGLNNVYDVSIFIGNLFGELKEKNYLKPVSHSFIKKAKKAAGILLRNDAF